MQNIKKAQQAAIWGMSIGDSMAMPAHWFYNPRDIKNIYGGWIKKFEAACKNHPSCILTLSEPDGSGRKGGYDFSKQVVGNAILHDKRKFWVGGDRSVHYHNGMKAGDNTLNALCALQVIKSLHNTNGREAYAVMLEDYVKFMTTPGSHNDTYCESFHRTFFREWLDEKNQPTVGEDILKFRKRVYAEAKGKSEDSQALVVGALVMVIPVIVKNAHLSADECAERAVEQSSLTHPQHSLAKYVKLYAKVLHSTINGKPLKESALQALCSNELGHSKDDVLDISKLAKKFEQGSEDRLKVYQSVASRFGLACYIKGALSTLMFVAHEFHDDFEGGVLCNTNIGGENCHRGAALGALLGASAAQQGKIIPEHLTEGLNQKELIKDLISKF